MRRWARVLQKLPGQFLFVRQEFQSYWLRQNILTEFERHNISRSEFTFSTIAWRNATTSIATTKSTLRSTLSCHRRHHHHGCPLDGCSVVGLKGPNVHQRVCSAILHHAGHPEWIANSDDEFVQIALISLLIRRGVSRCDSHYAANSNRPLCNAQQFANDFAAAMESLRDC